MPNAFGNALGQALAGTSSPQAATAPDSGTPSPDFSLAAGNNGRGLRLGGGQGLVQDGMSASGLTEDEMRLFQMHTQDSNPYANLAANGNAEYLTAQDYWNRARNQADSDLTARIQDHYTREAAQLGAQRQADSAQASTANNQREADNRRLWREAEAQYKSTGPVAAEGIKGGFTEGSGGAAVGYLRGGRRADPNGISRAIANWDRALASGVEAVQDFAVDKRIPALYVAAGLLPRSTAELAAGAVLGPVAGRAIGAGIGLANGAAAGTVLATDLGVLAGRVLNEATEFAAERVLRLHQGLGLQPAVVGNTGARVTNTSALDSVATKSGELPEKLYHYTSEGTVPIILENGLQPGAFSGKVFTTPMGTYTPIEAQMYLGLSPNRGLPGALFEIDTGALRSLGLNPSGGPMRVLPTPNAMGYGTEITFEQAIPPSVLRQVR